MSFMDITSSLVNNTLGLVDSTLAFLRVFEYFDKELIKRVNRSRVHLYHVFWVYLTYRNLSRYACHVLYRSLSSLTRE